MTVYLLSEAVQAAKALLPHMSKDELLNLITQIMTWSLTATSPTITERLWLSFQGFWFFKPLVERRYQS